MKLNNTYKFIFVKQNYFILIAKILRNLILRLRRTKNNSIFFILLLIMKNEEHSDITLQNYQFKQLSSNIFSKDVSHKIKR